MKATKKKAHVHIFLDRILLSRKNIGKFYAEFIRPHFSTKTEIIEIQDSNVLSIHAPFSFNCTFRVLPDSKVLSKILKLKVYKIDNEHSFLICTYDIELKDAYYEVIEQNYSQTSSIGLITTSIVLSSNTAVKFRENTGPKILQRINVKRNVQRSIGSLKIEEDRLTKIDLELETLANSNTPKVSDFHPISITAISIIRSNQLMKTKVIEKILNVVSSYINYSTETKIVFLIVIIHLLASITDKEDQMNYLDTDLKNITVKIYFNVINDILEKFADANCVDVVGYFNSIGNGSVCRQLFTAILANFANETGRDPKSFFIRESRYIQCMSDENPRIASLKQVLNDLHH